MALKLARSFKNGHEVHIISNNSENVSERKKTYIYFYLMDLVIKTYL